MKTINALVAVLIVISLCNLAFGQEKKTFLVRLSSSAVTANSTNTTTATAPINDDNLVFTSTITIGTPAKTFNAIFDITSSDLAVAGSNCKTSDCTGKTLYKTTASSTWRKLNKTIPGYANVTILGTDTVRYAGKVVAAQTIIVASSFSTGYTTTASAVVGLGFTGVSGGLSFVQRLINSGAITDNIFSIYLDENSGNSDSQILFGGTDTTKYSGVIHWRPVTSTSYWATRLVSITLNNERVYYCQSPCRAILSSYDPYIYGPSVWVKTILKKLNVSSDCSNYWDLPRVVFHLGPHYLSIPQTSYITVQDGKCVPLIFPSTRLKGNFVLGNLFLRSYYTVYDIGARRIGWAALNPTIVSS